MSKILRKTEDLVEYLLALLFFFFGRLSKCHRRGVIVYYHSLKEDQRDGFDRQMSYLASHCSVVTLKEMMSKVPDDFRPTVSITFDDGFMSVRDNALPILKKYDLPAAVFVPTAAVGERPGWQMSNDCADKKEVVMDFEDIKKLDQDGFEIFSHSHSHAHLPDITRDELHSELQKSKQILEDTLGHEVTALSYPYGEFDDKVCKAAKDAGYRFGFTIEPGTIANLTDLFKVGRFTVSPDCSLLKFKLKVSGAYQVSKYTRGLKRFFRRFI